jgi:tripeptide aminopeptidase
MAVKGELEYENFNAAGAKITFKEEKCIHAKGKMINSMLIANEFINAPIDETPQETKGYEGFIMCITYPEALKKLF